MPIKRKFGMVSFEIYGFSYKRGANRKEVDLHFLFRNFVRIHQTLMVTPAVEAKPANRLWSFFMIY